MNKKIYCSECKREIKDGHSFFIDTQPVCYECLFGKVKPVMIYPIGKVSQINSDGISRIDLFPYQQRFMYKLEEEKWITVVYYLHKVNSINSVFKRGKEGNGKKAVELKKLGVYRQWLLLNVLGASKRFLSMKKLAKGESGIAGNIG